MSGATFDSGNYKSFFSWKRFEQLDKSEREALIRCAVEQVSREKGLKNKVTVDFFKGDPASRGSCGQDVRWGKCTHVLRLNGDVLTNVGEERAFAPYMAFNTINHELEHASQYERSADRSIGNDDPATLEQRINDRHYYSWYGDKRVGGGARTFRFGKEKDRLLYSTQACEADARASGLTAVEGLREDGVEDLYLENYIGREKAYEILRHRKSMQQLGIHSREEMAREELRFLPPGKVSEQDGRKLLEHARQKDYEAFQTVMKCESNGMATEEQTRAIFDSGRGFPNFFESEEFRQNKVTESEHSQYSCGNYKWDEQSVADGAPGQDYSETQAKGVSPTAVSLSDRAGESPPQNGQADDRAFFKNVENAGRAPSEKPDANADRAFFESVENGTAANAEREENRLAQGVSVSKGQSL